MVRAWLKLLWNSAAVAAVAVAAQLGVADMLGVIRWQSADPVSSAAWNALLTWVCFSFAVAVVTGALAGRRAVQRADRADGIGARIAATLLAGVGASAGIGLAWLSAKDATAAPVRVNPALVVAITAGAGVLVGIVISLIALSALPVAAGLRTSIAWLWLVAIACAVVGITTHKPYPAPRLGVVDVPSLVSPSVLTGPRLMIGIAVLLALVVAGIARWAGAGRFGIALAGFGGPAMVAASYLIAGPGEGTGRAAQFEPYQSAVLATAGGLIASVLIAMPGRRRAERRATAVPEQDEGLPLLFGDLISPEPPPMPASFGPAARSGPFGAPYGYADSSAAEPVGRRSGGLGRPAGPAPSVASMDYPTNEQPMVIPQQSPYPSVSTGTTYGSRASGQPLAPVSPPPFSPAPFSPAPVSPPAPPFPQSPGPAPSLSSLSVPPEPGPVGQGGQGPLIGQPGSSEAHESWLRDLGSPGKHSADRR